MNPFIRFTSAIVTLLGLAVALYVGIWVLLIGGVANMIQAFNPFIPGLFSLGLVKFLVCDVAIFAIFYLANRISAWLEKGHTNDNPQTS
jgi:hypothetical protein